ncbi:MAG: hypothetical protein R3F60_13785 [bacterium]
MTRWWWLALGLGLLGCGEDRPAAPGPDGADAGADVAVPDAGVPDPVPDAAPDAASDAAPDAAPDAEAPDAAPPDPCAAPLDFMALAHPEGDGYAVDGLTGDVDAAQGSCGGGDADATWRFVAPTAGTWLLLVDDPSPGYDPVLHARSACADPATEVACHDNLPDELRARVHLTLAAGEAAYVFVDAANRRGGFYHLVARPIPALQREDPCDPNGLQNACPPGDACSTVDGRCAEDAAPTLGAVRVSPLADGAVEVAIEGHDAGRDVVRAALQLYARGQRVVIDPARGTDTWLLRPARSVLGEVDFVFGFRGVLLRPLPPADHARVQLRDAQGNRSPWRLVPLTAGAVLAPGEACDAPFAACAAGTACRLDGKARRCAWLQAPTIVSAHVTWTPEGVGCACRPATRMTASAGCG